MNIKEKLINIKEWLETLSKSSHSRRRFLSFAGKTIALFSALPLLIKSMGRQAKAAMVSPKVPKSPVTMQEGNYILLKNGFIVDGSGKKGFNGSLLIHDNKIEKISAREITGATQVIDCAGLVIMPGIIDAHSHMDWYLPIKGHDELKLPFTAQGVTTFMAGQCGYGVAGFRKKSPFINKISRGILNPLSIEWDTMAQYYDHVKRIGMTHNMMTLAGHGTTRTSIRGFNAAPMSKDEIKEMLTLLERSMDEGAAGVSLGLQYEMLPGITKSVSATSGMNRRWQIMRISFSQTPVW